ncbi:hypothetical protein PMIN06_011335 [Paraphaeosphaeria minitans]|uniref:Uncharacterized protein n=1 Tax=Paraphaeosphaeria minitans TaxID=565426 RepID=A0A9P6GBM9_9PLEO|nr:hypothetical protein PMIN01_10170 [Paraphaeosphaeria minitans]
MSSENHSARTITDPSSSGPDAADRVFTILNRGDRFRLAEDSTVEAGNLDNDIHPIFHDAKFLGESKHLGQALRLASLYITTPTLLQFYLPLAFGDHVTIDGRFHRVLDRPDNSDREHEIQTVESFLMCMSHTSKWEWVDFETVKKWGSTQLYFDKSLKDRHTEQCPTVEYDGATHFHNEDRSSLIKLNRGILDFYLDEETGYVTRSRCEQFRHDFQLALVLGHEIAHAFGAMCHGHLSEPYLSEDHPSNELGFAWENFIFGALIDPVDRDPRGNYIHVHKTWQSRDVRQKYKGTEQTAVPAAWTAQWFRRETWDAIAIHGHHAVNLPDPTLKVYFSAWGRYIVFTNNEDAWADLESARYSASLGLSFLFVKGSRNAVTMEGVSGAVWMPMIGPAKRSLMATPQRRFDDEVVDDLWYLQNAKAREKATWRVQEVAEKRSKRLAKTSMVSVAAGLMKSNRHATGLTKPSILVVKPESVCMSVAAGPMSSSSSDSSSSVQVRSRAKRSRDADHLDLFLLRKRARRGY